ncbi:MAG: DUF4625 domain-containing protein [Treponema sp.]|nr:DUF4625 domain-containing protein [Treponema sp.]
MRRILRFMAMGLVFFLPYAAFAAGGRQIITEPADGIDIWQKEFDVSHMKPGTYNFIVSSRDAAGNVGVSGPFNVRVDPKAGLPEVNIIYPEQGQVVRGDLIFVGVATARYGMKQLYFRMDDEEYRPIEGKEFWTLRISQDEVPEGRHTVYVKAEDQSDLEGDEFRLDFILDNTPPLVELVDREVGDLISGNVKVKAKVTDVNGIQSVSLSRDGGQTFTNMRTTAGKRGEHSRYFQFSIPTKRHEDGPLVYFVRAVNCTGYTETKPILFFVNNEPPIIEILSPETNETAFGPTQITGRVLSGVGLSRFYYDWEGERVEIPLRPGDPFWSVVINISLANNRAIPFRITAVDRSGNTTVVSQRFQDTRRYRTPTIEIDYPSRPGGLGVMQLAHDQAIYGRIADGFIPRSIFTDNADFFIENIEAAPSFRIPPEFIPVGRNNLRLYAVSEDEATSMGNAVITLRINKASPPDGFRLIESPVTIDEPEYWNDYGDYMIPWRSDSVTYRGYVENFSAGNILEYRMNWNDSWKQVNLNNRGDFSLTVSLADQREGPVPIEFRTTRGGVPDQPLYSPVNKYVTKPEMRFLTPDRRFGIVQRATTASGIVDYVVPLAKISYSTDGSEFIDMDFTPKYHKAWFQGFFDFTALNADRQVLTIRVTDRAGNVIEATPDFEFDNSDALPKLILNAPLDDELITGEFVIDGLAYSDVGIEAIYYRILTPMNPWDSAEITMDYRRSDIEFDKIETTQNYQIPMGLLDVRDGINILEIFSEDIYGIQGEVTTRVFRVSTTAPEITITDPVMTDWSRQNLAIRGTAFDRNGLKEMLFSMDNGVSYQRADFASGRADDYTGNVTWGVNLNTQAYSDGIYSMLIRAVDSYGIDSYTAAIINLDNTPPTIDLGSPGNGDKVGETLTITGQVYDNIGLGGVSIQLVNTHDPSVQVSYELPETFVIMETIDVSGFPDDDYTLKVTAFDYAGNEVTVNRNLTLIKARAASEVAIINPLPGIDHSGPVTVSGRITGAVVPETVTLMMNHRSFADVDVNRYGVFRFDMPKDIAWTGEPVIFSAAFQTPDGDRIVSYDSLVRVSEYGPVLVVDSHRDGDIVTKRPWITGKAYIVGPDDPDLTQRQAKAARGVKRVELSFDNGRTFTRAKGKENWRYRLETSMLPAGNLPIIVRATFENGSVAVRRILLTVDVTPPFVNTIGPVENSTHRNSILIYGSTFDDYDMDVVEVSLRPGDKIGYAVPGFIQGLYIDGSVLGGVQWATGLGLTFFDDNVKVQAVAARGADNSRYGGWAFGGKILANVFNQNMSQYLGLDWEFWRTSLVIGAQFLYFMMEEDETPLVMGQLLGQWEIIKADMGFFFPKWKYFKSLSLYTEPGLWFAPSDVDTSNDTKAWRYRFTIGFGFRASLF